MTKTPPTPTAGTSFSLAIRLYGDYQQIVDFRMPGVAVLGLDESPPRGRGWGPSPAHLLGSALGSCLGAALLHDLRERQIEVVDLRTDVSGTVRTDMLRDRHLANLTITLSPVLTRRTDVDRMPAPEDLAERSMIAGSIRTGLGLWIAITPEVRTGTRTAPHGARSHAATADAAAIVPHFVEPAPR
jgi:uncharacterized OsmC-like protein